MEANDRANQPTSEGVTRQRPPSASDRNGEARPSGPGPETTAPLFRDYSALTGRSAPGLPHAHLPVSSPERDYSRLTGRT
jgi:hypothetical protein